MYTERHREPDSSIKDCGERKEWIAKWLQPQTMAPIISNLFFNTNGSGSGFHSVKSQWQNPNDILTILTIIGGDIVQRAVAQLSGHPSYITPVAFSFGWVGYTLNMVVAIMGEGRVMPPADCDCVVVNAKSMYSRTNRSWVLGRLVRDHDANPLKPGLTVTFFEACNNGTDSGTVQGIPKADWVYFSGIGTILLQLAIAVIPGACYKDWTILMVTTIGTILALAGGALPKWRKEKWNGRLSREGDRSVMCLTRGNGYSDVLVIISEGKGHYKLEDLANARTVPVPGTTWVALVLCIAQILLLLTVAGLNSNAWYLLAIGTFGMVQNALAAGVPRDSSTSGIHFKEIRDSVIAEKKVFRALQRAEEAEPYVGLCLLPIFFPGGLRPDEEEWRKMKLEENKTRNTHPSPDHSGENNQQTEQSHPYPLTHN